MNVSPPLPAAIETARHLYESDPYAWALLQAEAMREQDPSRLDWPNIAEELEGLALSQLRSVESGLENALLHLLKMAAWPEHAASRGWMLSVSTGLRIARKWHTPGMSQKIDVAALYRDARGDLLLSEGPDLPRPKTLTVACPFSLDELLDPTLGGEPDLRPRLLALAARCAG